MVIRFLCPNGHKIHCPDQQAGRAAKCPQCGVRFRVPSPAETQAPTTGGDSGVSPAAGLDLGAPGNKVGLPGKEPQIEFLCPNGHRLHGPASLQGRPGQCPDCGARFRIPTYDDVSDEEELEQDISLGRAAGAEDSGVALEEVEELGQPADVSPAGDRSDLDQVQDTAAAGSAARRAELHPWAVLFSKLWAQKPAEAVVELHLASGEPIVPDQFAQTLSQHGHGVFAVKNSDGTYTLAAIPWDSVCRVLVRGLKQVPDQMTGD